MTETATSPAPASPEDRELQAILRRAQQVFGALPRPDHFTDHEHCCECAEHDRTLAAHDPASIPREALGHMGWDPITFTDDTAFRYYLPGLIRVVMTTAGDDEYFEQFLWHVSLAAPIQDRHAACTPAEREVVAATLRFLLDYRTAEVEAACQGQELLDALERWH